MARGTAPSTTLLLTGNGPLPASFYLSVYRPEDDQREQAIATRRLEVAPDQSAVIDLEIEAPEPEAPPSPKATEVIKNVARIPVAPPTLDAYLRDNHLETIADIRRAGGLHRQEDWSKEDTDVAEILESYANLSVLSSDEVENQKLIDKNFPQHSGDF